MSLMISKACNDYLVELNKPMKARLFSSDYRCLISEKKGGERARFLLAHLARADNSFFHVLEALEYLRRSSSKKLKKLVFAQLLSGDYGEYYVENPKYASGYQQHEYITEQRDTLRSEFIESGVGDTLGEFLSSHSLIWNLPQSNEPNGFTSDKILLCIDLIATVGEVIRHDFKLRCINKNTEIELREITKDKTAEVVCLI